jgi:hypothetical protein
VAALRAVRKESYFNGVGALIAVTAGQIARLDPAAGFDDFCLCPYPGELNSSRSRSSTASRPGGLQAGPISPAACAPTLNSAGRKPRTSQRISPNLRAVDT